MTDYDPTTAPDPLDGAMTAATILGNEYPPIEYVVPGLIPEGLTLLVAAPKVGKSWMMLGIALAAASGGVALGSIPVDRRPVLYLTLEDGERRIQDRLKKLTATPEADLRFMTSLGTCGPVEVISAFIRRNAEEHPLVILDTLGRVRGVGNGADNYGRDYTQMAALKACVDEFPGSSLIVVHHTNKGAHGDFLSAVSGTQGLAGAADSIAVIQRERDHQEGTLHITSRDALEGEYGVRLSPEGAWAIEGGSLAGAAQAVQNRQAQEGTGDTMRAVLAAVQDRPEGLKPQQVAAVAGVDEATARQYLRRAVKSGRLSNPSRGLYTPVTSVTSVTTEGPEALEVTQVTDVTPLGDAPGTFCSVGLCTAAPVQGTGLCERHSNR
ncbi:AAA family ATPase [Kocuria rhizophila]|uniref:AAA family ATPase n=1 Tax=Kocuria rhizophila TaxID=72000 RepID=UPI0011AB22ED|nr:AAA family ATPase [Kocuria rhizophila]